MLQYKKMGGWFYMEWLKDLFENPFLAQIMSEHWDIVKTLSETGVDLRGHSVTKLSRELGETVHLYLTKKADVEVVNNKESTHYEAISSVDTFLKFAQEIKKRNYCFMPDAETLIDNYMKQELEIENAKAETAKTQAILNKKTHGYKEYLKKIGKAYNDNKTKRKIRKKKR